MNKKCLIGAMFLMAILQPVLFANPSVDLIVREYSTNPSWIEVMCYLPSDLSGFIIETTTGEAVVSEGVFGGSDSCVLLDHSNTTGFTLNVEGDSIIFRNGDIWFSNIGYGNKGPYAVPPLQGESAMTAPNGGIEFNFCPDPTPGERGDDNFPGCTWSLTDIIINEIAVNNSWNNCSDFIELLNWTDNPVDISGYQIICNSRYIIPEGTIIQANNRFVLDECDYPENFCPNLQGDNIYLIRQGGAAVDQVGWSSNHGENVSFMRFPDGNARWGYFADFSGYDDESSITFMNGFPSRRGINRPESPGLKIIGLTAEVANGTVNLFWTDPIWITTFQASIIRKSYDSFPNSPFEGELIYEGCNQKHLGDVVPENQTAYYTVFARTGCGEYSLPDSESQISVVMGTSGAGENRSNTARAIEVSCYPNPFNARTSINFTIPENTNISLAIFDLSGRKLITLAEGRFQRGEYRANWDASGYPSGIYLANLRAREISMKSKLILMK